MKPIKRPLSEWVWKMIELYNKAKEISREVTCLVYFCLLNYKNVHFTLLKINKQEKVIHYYNLIADKDVINDTIKLTQMDRLVKIRCSFNNKSRDALNLITEGV
jgi:hypothetical protein